MAKFLSKEEMEARMAAARGPPPPAPTTQPQPQPPGGHPSYIPMQQPAYATYYAGPPPGQPDYGRVPAGYHYQQPYAQGQYYVDPYAVPAQAQPPPPSAQQRPDDPDGAIFTMPPGGWTPRHSYWYAQRGRRQPSMSTRSRAKRYGDDEEYDIDDEEEDPEHHARVYRRHTHDYVRRRRSSSRQRPGRMTPTMQVNSFAGGYAAVSLHGSDTIKILNLQGREVIHRVQATLDHFWTQKSELSHSRDGFNWTFKLAGRPWTATGDEGIRAKRTLTRLYTTLASCGYSFVCTTNAGKLLSPPSQLFEACDKTGISATATYIGLTISASKRKITLIDLPPVLATRIRDLVRNYFPDCSLNGFPPRSAAYDTGEDPQLHEDELLAQGIIIVRLPGLFDRVPSFGVPRQYETTSENVMGHLKFVLDSAGFALTATVPLDLPLVTLRGRRQLILYRALGMYYGSY